jgi:hypothetical protein
MRASDCFAYLCFITAFTPVLAWAIAFFIESAYLL